LVPLFVTTLIMVPEPRPNSEDAVPACTLNSAIESIGGATENPFLPVSWLSKPSI
jgi:hypothetical protein